MRNSDFKVYPLGGVAEIGSNMTVFEFKNQMLVVDCGILFPYEDFFDINYLIVDPSQLADTNKDVILFITHGHEDHIGAIYHFLTLFPKCEVFAPRFARELILKKLDRDKISHPIHLYDEKLKLTFDKMTLTPVHVTHSIPDTYGIILTSQNNDLGILFISDFKYDLNPQCEEPFNTKKILQTFSLCNRRIAFLDSTNILNKNKTVSESELVDSFETILQRKKRTFITLFASNIYRLKNILDLAQKHDRKVCFIGRSLHRYLEAAESSHLIDTNKYPIVDIDSISNLKDSKLIFIVTGSQGEHLGAARRISLGDQKGISLDKDDLFVFSSKAIPGNEKKIYRIINKIAETDCTVITNNNMVIHASGHPGQQDLIELVEQVNPTDIIPIHGESYFLKEHINFIKKNFSSIQPHFIQNYDVLLFQGSQFKILYNSPRDPVIIHGNKIPISRERISERRKMACNGLVVIAINHKTKNIHVETKGLPSDLDDKKVLIKDLCEHTAFQEYKNRDHDFVLEKIRIKTRKFCQGVVGYKPITIVSMV